MVPDRPGIRLRTLADVFAYAQAEGAELRLDATEIQVCRPMAGRGGRRAFVSGPCFRPSCRSVASAADPGDGPTPCWVIASTTTTSTGVWPGPWARNPSSPDAASAWFQARYPLVGRRRTFAHLTY